MSRPHHRGGTLIVSEVHDLEAHRRRLADPDGYRPATCPCCHRASMHRHDYRTRKPAALAGVAEVVIVRFRCYAPTCHAVWQVLPGFLPRHLWSPWPRIEATVLPPTPPPAAPPSAALPVAPTPVPARTVGRWQARLATAARGLVQLLATVGGAVLDRLAAALGLDATRAALVDAYAAAHGVAAPWRLATLAAHVHRLAPGWRLM